MGRRKRPHAPGMAFHLFTRTHHSRKWFVPELRTEIAGLIQTTVARTDADLLAYAIMPNHLHLIVRQGELELSTLMQPLMRRVANRVQRFHGFEGGVVERRFRDRLCRSPDHLRAALIYVHLNPWQAGLCRDDLDYGWMTHAAYLPGSDPAPYGISAATQLRALELFALGDDRSRDQLCRDYLRQLEVRMARSTAVAEEALAEPAIGPPRVGRQVRSDAWTRHFAAAGGESYKRRPTMDLRDFIMAELERREVGVPLELMRGPWISRQLHRIRVELIQTAADRRYRTCDIGRFFGISPQAVSNAKYRT